MICRYCGEHIEDDSRFCDECGSGMRNGATGAIEPCFSMPGPGTLIDRYEIIRELGEGGMSSVYQARDTEDDTRVAIKVLIPDLVSHNNILARFRDESRLQMKLHHRHLLQVYDFVQQDNVHAIVMEYVDGVTLDEVIHQTGALSLLRIKAILCQVLDAVGHAHSRGVVHRDLKPSNIMIAREEGKEVARVTDFAIAKDLTGGGAGTNPGTIMGTPLYMSPEQCKSSRDVDTRSDIYSLGVMLYEMATGKPPFEWGNITELFRAQIEAPPPSPRSAHPGVSPELERVILTALEKDPDRRFQCAEDFSTALMDVPEPQPSEMIGRYQVIGTLDEGEMCTVYHALDVEDGGEVALKVLAPDLVHHEHLLDRLRQEARQQADLRHRNMLGVDGVVEQDGLFAVVMEYLEGITLQEEIYHHTGPLTPERIHAVMLRVLDAVDYAHSRKVVHADLTSSNIFLGTTDNEEVVKVTDFGAPKAGPDVSMNTNAGGERAPAEYMSPERIMSPEEVDVRSDIYSLGVILYEMATGRLPFVGESDFEVMQAHVQDQPPPPRGIYPEVSSELEKVILTALQKDPDKRFQTARELSAALQCVAQTHRGSDTLASLGVGSITGQHAVPTGRGDGTGDSGSGGDPPTIDEDVQFTVYRPRAVQPARWYPMLVFTHHAAPPADASPDAPDPVEEVRRQARQVLEQLEEFQDLTQDAARGIPRGGELSLVPDLAARTAQGLVQVEFNPPLRSFRWLEDIHQEKFQLRAPAGLRGKTARGRLTIYLGALIVAEVNMALRIDGSAAQGLSEGESARDVGRPFGKVFASYSHRDTRIVDQFQAIIGTIGHEYLRDLTHLRTGQVWSREIKEMITRADVFQLFWSTNARSSTYVEKEWLYALDLGRTGDFVRPVYWERPMPEPPAPLAALHFSPLPSSVPIPTDNDDPGSSSAPGGGPTKGLRALLRLVPLWAVALVFFGSSSVALSPMLVIEPQISPVTFVHRELTPTKGDRKCMVVTALAHSGGNRVHCTWTAHGLPVAVRSDLRKAGSRCKVDIIAGCPAPTTGSLSVQACATKGFLWRTMETCRTARFRFGSKPNSPGTSDH